MQTLKKYKKRAIKTVLAICASAVLLAGLVPITAQAACDQQGDPCGTSGNLVTSGGSTATSTTASDPNCNDSSDAGVQKCLKNNQIVKDLNIIVDFLSAGVGIIVIGVIILGGIQYSLAGDNATATGAAKKRITDGLIALLAFIFTFALLQWLIPGGL